MPSGLRREKTRINYLSSHMIKHLTKDSLIIAIFVIVILASAGDIIADLQQGAKTSHLIQEGIILILACSALIWILQSIKLQHEEILQLHAQLEEANKLPERLDKDSIDTRKTLGEFISQQFNRWNLSKSEREVGQLLLKGFSHKEIALLRGTAEKTIRQQASAIYQKAGVSGRHAFSAWFIEDIL